MSLCYVHLHGNHILGFRHPQMGCMQFVCLELLLQELAHLFFFRMKASILIHPLVHKYSL